MSGLTEAHKNIKLLVTPTEALTASDTTTTSNDWFENVLANKIQEYSNSCGYKIGDVTTEDVKFTYVRNCINSLVNLRIELVKAVKKADLDSKTSGAGDDDDNDVKKASKPSPAADIISISHQKDICSLVQMVVSLGILPNLIPGVGLALEKRSKFLQSIITGSSSSSDLKKPSILDKYKRLVYTLESLLDLAQHRSLSQLIMTKHLGDVLAALVQIGYAPIKKPDKDKTPPKDIDLNHVGHQEEEEFVMTEQLYDRLANDQVKYKKELEKIVEKTYQPLVIKYFLILQTSSPSSKPPKWLTKAVGGLLSHRLMADNGVVNVIRGVMDLGGVDDNNQFDWKKMGLVSSVLASPPSSSYGDTENYYRLICPQLLSLLDHEDKIFQMMGCAAIRATTERSLILSRRYLLDPLMAPLMKLCDDHPLEEALAVTEKEIDDCLKNLFKIFVIGNDPSVMFVNHLEAVILVLLQVHARVTFSASHLRDPVSQLVNRFLKHSDRATSLMVLRAFAFSSRPVERKNRVGMMNPEVDFVNGDEGGVGVVEHNIEGQSFYVADDERAIVVQDLLEAVKDKKLSIDFFLALMNDLTEIMIDDEEDDGGDVVGDDLELPTLAAGGEGLEQKLLDLNAHLDRTMQKMRTSLMVVRLLGLLSEDDKLQEDVMDESEKLIKFVGATLRRGAIMCGEGGKKKKKVNDDDDDDDPCVDGGGSGSVMAVQSLNMALSILCVQLTQKNVSVDDWRQAQDLVDDLAVLAGHSDPRIGKMAGQLHRLVLTHGVVLDQTRVMKENTEKIREETNKMKEKSDELRAMRKEMEDEKMDENKKKLGKKVEEVKTAKESRRKGRGGAAAAVEIREDENDATKETNEMSEYQLALFDLGDPLLPVRGHGIIELTRLVEKNDEETITNVGKVGKIFTDSLEDDDTYIYCSAINGLVACARYNTEAVLDTLTKEFSLVAERKVAGGDDKSVEIRTKVGEALVRVTRELADLTPKYKVVLLNTFFSAANDPDPLIRSSSLSNLGEVCRNLRFSLSGVAGEVVNHLAMSSRDTDVTVRRAAVMVVTLLLQGLGRDSFRVLDSQLRDLYRGLKAVAVTETDEVILTHVNNALEEIDKIVRDFLAPQQQLEKKIFVLDAPPDPF